MSLRLRKCRAVLVAASVLCMASVFALDSRAQTPTPSPSPSPTPATASCGAIAPCPKLAPRFIQLTVIHKKGDQPWQQADKDVTQLTRKRFYLSSCPFNFDKAQAASRAPTRKTYYAGAKASPQLIKWLEDNNCDTVYCRELRREEVTCAAADSACVPEFVRAYAEALKKLKGNADSARRWVTNYEPLSAPELRTGFYKEKAKWLDAAIKEAERAASLPAGTVRTAMTDKNGVAYFYDLCPGTYYISNVAPIEVGDEGLVWETTAITVKAPTAKDPDQLEKIPVFFANVPPKKKRANYFVAKRVARAGATSTGPADGKSAGQ
jgi:hypothetical protein